MKNVSVKSKATFPKIAEKRATETERQGKRTLPLLFWHAYMSDGGPGNNHSNMQRPLKYETFKNKSLHGGLQCLFGYQE